MAKVNWVLWNNYDDDDDQYLLDVLRCITRNKELPEKILVIANLGLWDGRRTGYKEISKLDACFYDNDCDFCKWSIDSHHNLRFVGDHHDGTNYYLYRMWKPGLSDFQKENLKTKIYFGKATSKDISRYTQSIGRYFE